jgi:Fe2+ transport system protein B
MRIARSVTFGCLLVVWLLAITGCSKKETRADENKPIDEVKAEALKMNAEELKEMALKYKEALTAKQAELDKIAAKLDNLSVTEVVEATKKMQPEIEKLANSLAALKERFQIYFQKLKEKGGDVTGLEI